jgi:hypothetical protein
MQHDVNASWQAALQHKQQALIVQFWLLLIQAGTCIAGTHGGQLLAEQLFSVQGRQDASKLPRAYKGL